MHYYRVVWGHLNWFSSGQSWTNTDRIYSFKYGKRMKRASNKTNSCISLFNPLHYPAHISSRDIEILKKCLFGTIWIIPSVAGSTIPSVAGSTTYWCCSEADWVPRKHFLKFSINFWKRMLPIVVCGWWMIVVCHKNRL